MTVAEPRNLLTSARMRRAEVFGRASRRFTAPQASVFESPYRYTLWWGANGIGKSYALAELATRALAGELYWQDRTRPRTVIVCGNTWAQVSVLLAYMWQGRARSWFKDGVRFEGGTMRGQRLHIYTLVAGPGKGSELRLGTFRAENLAGPRADVVIGDEPLPKDVHDELWPRLFGRGGRMYIGFTPTLGTSHKVGYAWDLVDDEQKTWAGEINTPLTLDAVTPRGGLVELPWVTPEEIDQFEQGVSAIQADMRMGRSRVPRMDTSYFSAWGPHLLDEAPAPPRVPVGIGIDHGSRPGAQRATLVAVTRGALGGEVWVLDHYMGNGRTESEEDAQGILEMLSRHGMSIEHVDKWVGDRAHHGDWRGGKKSNERLKAALAQAVGLNVERQGWQEKLPAPLRYMRTPRKYDRSVWEGVEILHRLMVGRRPRLHVHPRCRPLIEDIESWRGGLTDPHKDGIDSLRYITVPLLEGRTT